MNILSDKLRKLESKIIQCFLIYFPRWWDQPRWEGILRNYDPEDIARLRGTIQLTYPSQFLSKKLYCMLSDAYQNKSFHHTFGALDPVQLINLTKYLSTVYVSGWQCSSTASVTNEPGPDFADYPYHTVPTKVMIQFDKFSEED